MLATSSQGCPWRNVARPALTRGKTLQPVLLIWLLTAGMVLDRVATKAVEVVEQEVVG